MTADVVKPQPDCQVKLLPVGCGPLQGMQQWSLKFARSARIDHMVMLTMVLANTGLPPWGE